MNDLCPITYAKARVLERGYSEYRLVFRDLQLQPNATRILNAYNELWILLDADIGIRVASDYGVYDYNKEGLSEQIHEHADRITLVNSVNIIQKIKFLQVLMVAAPQAESTNVMIDKL